jgi:hypothetical protein
MTIRELLKFPFQRKKVVKAFDEDELLSAWTEYVDLLSKVVECFPVDINGLFHEAKSSYDAKTFMSLSFSLTKFIDFLWKVIDKLNDVENKDFILTDKHEKVILTVNEALAFYYHIRSLAIDDDYLRHRSQLDGIKRDFDRVYYKYVESLRLYDERQRTNVLKPDLLKN